MKIEKLNLAKFQPIPQSETNKVKGGCNSLVVTGKKDGSTAPDGVINDCLQQQ